MLGCRLGRKTSQYPQQQESSPSWFRYLLAHECSSLKKTFQNFFLHSEIFYLGQLDHFLGNQEYHPFLLPVFDGYQRPLITVYSIKHFQNTQTIFSPGDNNYSSIKLFPWIQKRNSEAILEDQNIWNKKNFISIWKCLLFLTFSPWQEKCK